MKKVVVVTGGNRGLGLEIARDVRTRGHDVVIVSRSFARGAAAARALEAESAGGEVRVVEGDLGSVDGVLETGAKLLARCPSIDVLVHNAGLWPSARRRDARGLEEAFVVNHLAPFALNHLLLPRLAERRGRVVLVTAGLYVAGRPSVARTPTGEDFHPLRTYPTTKACALSLLPRFSALFAAHGVALHAVHPGVLRTGLGDRAGALGAALSLVKRLWKPASEGARAVTRLAFDEAFVAPSGRLFLELEEASIVRPADDAELASALYAHAVAVTGVGA